MNSSIKRIMMIAAVLLPLVLTTACHAGPRRGGSYVSFGWSPPYYRSYRVVRTKPVKAKYFRRAPRNAPWVSGHYSPGGRWIQGHWLKGPRRGGRSVWRPGRHSPGGIWISGYWSR